jgi:hypothetical protein
MLAADHYQGHHLDVAIPKRQLFEIHRSKISLHHARADYNYPTIRLPHTLSALAGLPMHIYQTVHQGALAFLVVVSSSHKVKKAQENQKTSPPALNLRLYTAKVGRSNRLEPICFLPIGG